MRRAVKYAGIALLSCMVMLSATGCGGAGESVALNYGTGMDGLQYDASLFARNDLDTVGADPGGIYVSKEQSEEYGGYYYVYTTGGSGNSFNSGYLPSEYTQEGIVGLSVKCYRSKDLSQWESAGSLLDGYCIAGYSEDWENWYGSGNVWAPEVIYDAATQKYYMYYNMYAKGSSGAVEVSANGFYIGVAVSDTPVGPFRALHNTDSETGVAIPLVNFEEHFGFSSHMPVIDVSPFRDPKEGGKLYLYFKGEATSGDAINSGHIYGMEMQDWTTPNYETIKCLLAPRAVSVTCDEGAEAALKLTGKQTVGTIDDALTTNILEAPQCIEHNGKYYLTYSANGFTDASYSVWQAVGTSPMGPFTKTSAEEGNPIISGASMPYANGSGHHTFVRNGDELYAIYHVHGHESQISYAIARYLFADRASFADDKIVVNGPSNCLMWLPESVSGYQNLARSAKIEVSSGQGETYLNDEILPYYAYNENAVYSKNGDITVTLKFDRAVSVRAIMIYNAPTVYSAFSKIDKIEFELAEKAAFMNKDYKIAVITDLEYPKVYLSETDESEYKACAPAVAEFEEIKVNSIKITLSAGNKLINYNKDGSQNKTLALSEIVVLGVTL